MGWILIPLSDLRIRDADAGTSGMLQPSPRVEPWIWQFMCLGSAGEETQALRRAAVLPVRL